MPLRVLHLVGSPTSDFFADLSRLYARDCLAGLSGESGYEMRIAYVTPDGWWRFPTGLDDATISAAPPHGMIAALDLLRSMEIDVAVPQMFCRAGMTTYRSLLDLLDIPYVGNPADVMALGTNKARTRAVAAAGGVRVPEGEVLRDGDTPALAPPVVVKPVDADNSVGVSLVRTGEEFPTALAAALEHSDAALVERYVELGREVRCGVLERGDELVVLPLEEYAVDPVHKPVRDAADKLARHDGGELALVAKDAEHAWILDPDDPIAAAVGAAARAAHVALGCRHYSLFDFRVDPDGVPWLLEAGLYCSFARQSVVAVMAAAAGIPLAELFATAVTQALEGR